MQLKAAEDEKAREVAKIQKGGTKPVRPITVDTPANHHLPRCTPQSCGRSPAFSIQDNSGLHLPPGRCQICPASSRKLTRVQAAANDASGSQSLDGFDADVQKEVDARSIYVGNVEYKVDSAEIAEFFSV